MVTTLRSLFIVLMTVAPFVVVTGGCPGPDYPKCEKDDQCKKNKDGKSVNEYCLFGQCQQCAKDAHCAAGSRCNRGRCEAACTADSQCGAGQICEEATCQPAQCSDMKACGEGLGCTNGRCLSSQTNDQTKSTSGGQVTVGGKLMSCEKRQTIRFDFNMSDLRPDARETLELFSKCLAQNPAWRLTIEGHADERGTTDFNLQLGERRASSVKDYLARLGIDKARMKTISYGEEKPVDNSVSEDGWAKNRRGELVVQE